ncbi:hypothetical protein C0991_009855, partial [Blastosporella zonata]
RGVRLKLAQEVDGLAEEHAAQRSAQVVNVNPPAPVQAPLIISTGLVLEEKQRKLTADTVDLSTHPTAKQLPEALERSNQLRRKIAAWFNIQTLFIPEASRKRTQDDILRDTTAHDNSRSDKLAVYYGQDYYDAARGASGSQPSLSSFCEDDTISAIPLAFLSSFFSTGGLPEFDIPS